VTFCDASDVASEEFTFTYNPHLSCGQGLRYGTPLGAARLDAGYRIPGLQLLDKTDRKEPEPGGIFGVPVTISIGIGEAF
jgi:outer membrane protein insertion porin family/translocation and assembly module TamA